MSTEGGRYMCNQGRLTTDHDYDDDNHDNDNSKKVKKKLAIFKCTSSYISKQL